MGLLLRTALLAALLLAFLSWNARGAEAAVQVASGDEANRFVSLSGPDATAIPILREPGGLPIPFTVVSTGPNGTLYRFVACRLGVVEVTTPSSYGIHECRSHAETLQVAASLARDLENLTTRQAALARAISIIGAGTNATLANTTWLRLEAAALGRHLRAYPKTPAARYVIHAQAKWSRPR